MDLTYEKVHAIWDWLDGPSSGIADFGNELFTFIRLRNIDESTKPIFALQRASKNQLDNLLEFIELWHLKKNPVRQHELRESINILFSQRSNAVYCHGRFMKIMSDKEYIAAPIYQRKFQVKFTKIGGFFNENNLG